MRFKEYFGTNLVNLSAISFFLALISGHTSLNYYLSYGDGISAISYFAGAWLTAFLICTFVLFIMFLFKKKD